MSTHSVTNLHSMPLPHCLERWDDGTIVVRGHRLKLHMILERHYQGETTKDLHEAYPTLSPTELSEVLEFVARTEEACRQYYAECAEERRKIEASIPSGPSLEELRRRRDQANR